jgi:hypothetical protein
MAQFRSLDMEMGDSIRASPASCRWGLSSGNRHIIDSFEVFVREERIVAEPAAIQVNKIDLS